MRPDGYDSSAGSSLNSIGSNGAVVDVEGMELANYNLSSGRISGEVLQVASQSFSHIDPILPQDSIQVLFARGTPVEGDMGRIDGIGTGIEWMTSWSWKSNRR